MTKYWNPRRLERKREKRKREEARALVDARMRRGRELSYETGKTDKNADLILNALGFPLRRRMLARLKNGGAMSLSKLVEPFGITLPTAHVHLQALQRAGIVLTKKQGRTRICYYNRRVARELVAWLER